MKITIQEYKRIIKELIYIKPFIQELNLRKKYYEKQIEKYKKENN